MYSYVYILNTYSSAQQLTFKESKEINEKQNKTYVQEGSLYVLKWKNVFVVAHIPINKKQQSQ